MLYTMSNLLVSSSSCSSAAAAAATQLVILIILTITIIAIIISSSRRALTFRKIQAPPDSEVHIITAFLVESHGNLPNPP